MKHIALTLVATCVLILQAPLSSIAAEPSQPAAPQSDVDRVIELVKSGMSETLIIKNLQMKNKPANLTSADLLKLQKAGISEAIIMAMMDPSTATAPAAATGSAPATAPSATPAPTWLPPPPPPTKETLAAAVQADKRRVVVDEFDYSTVMTSVQAVFGTQQNIGKGIRSMLVKRIVDANQAVVVERAKLQQIQAEQDLNASNRAAQGKGARIGKIRGADAILMGDITVFGRDDKKTNIKGGGLVGSVIGGIARAKSEDKAVVGLTFRLVDAESSEVIVTGEARGESKRKSSGWGALGGALGKGLAGIEVDMNSSNFAETIIGEATIDAVNKIVEQFNQQLPNIKHRELNIECAVADVAGNVLTVTAGGNDGVKIGDVFEIFRVVREVRDPVTKEVLDKITEKTGEITIVGVRDKIATGTYFGQPAQIGFEARKKQ